MAHEGFMLRPVALQVINEAFMVKQTAKHEPEPDDSHHEKHPMSWVKPGDVAGELEEVGLCQYRTTEEAKACRMRGISTAACKRMPTCKSKGGLKAALSASGEPAGKGEAGGAQGPGLMQGFMCSCCQYAPWGVALAARLMLRCSLPLPCCSLQLCSTSHGVATLC